MKSLRQLTRKGDPVIRVQLPATIIRMIETEAKKNKRRRQDQFIKNIADTFKNEPACGKTFQKLLPDIKSMY